MKTETDVRPENFVLCTCYKKEGYYCKNWDGKGNVPAVTELMKTTCQTSPDTCEFLVTPIKRTSCDWIYKTISGSPVIATEIVQEEHKVVVKKKAKKADLRICVECSEAAIYKIEGYKPTYLCKLHAEVAKSDGFKVIELVVEEVDARR